MRYTFEFRKNGNAEPVETKRFYAFGETDAYCMAKRYAKKNSYDRWSLVAIERVN